MKVIEIVPKEVVAILEMPMSELELLHTALNNAVINYDSADENSVAAAQFVTGEFLSVLKGLLGYESE